MKELANNTPLEDFFGFQDTMGAQLLRLTFDASHCKNENFWITLNYHNQTGFGRPFQINMAREKLQRYQVYIPIYTLKQMSENPSLDIPSDYASCLTEFAQLEDTKFYPLFLPLIIPQDWKKEPLYQKISFISEASTISKDKIINFFSSSISRVIRKLSA